MFSVSIQYKIFAAELKGLKTILVDTWSSSLEYSFIRLVGCPPVCCYFPMPVVAGKIAFQGDHIIQS